MSGVSNLSCEQFDGAVDELAVGAMVEPERSALLAHAASCPTCEARLNGLAGLADRLLLLAPEVEPPAGFEAGVLARMGAAAPPSNVVSVAGRRRRHRAWAAAVVAAVALVGSGIVIGHTTRRPPAAAVAVHRGEILTASGDHIGSAGVYNRPAPYVLLNLYEPPRGGPLSCELETAQGRRVVVGSWDYNDLHGSVWAVGIDRSLVGAVRMRIVDQHGAVIATAALA